MLQAYEADTTSDSKSRSAQPGARHRADEKPLGYQFDPLERLPVYARGDASAAVQARALNHTGNSWASQARQSVIQLQRQYGNRHVQRVLALAQHAPVLQRQDDGSNPPGLPSPLGQSVTCSVDLAKLGAGSKAAAWSYVNCCESGFQPLPSGCSNQLLDGAHKILGTGGGSKDTSKCPPGFHAGTSSTYKGQCCLGTIESANNCCPAIRANTMGFCCKEGQVAQGLNCTDLSPAAPTSPATPPVPQSEPGDYEMPDESKEAVV